MFEFDVENVKRAPAVSLLVVVLLGCSGEIPSPGGEVAEQQQALMGESSYECGGGTCADGSDTNHERTMKLGRTAARSAAFLECMNRAIRTGIPNTDVLVTANMPAPGDCGSFPAYVYDGWGPYQSCTPYAELRFGADPLRGAIEHDGAWNERVDRQLARAFTAAQVDLDLHHRIGALPGGAKQAGSEADGTLVIDWGPLSPTAGLSTKIGVAGNDSGDVGTVWHEAFHDLGYDHGCQPAGTNHGNCGRTPLWDGARTMNNIAGFCVKEVLLRSMNSGNTGCGTTGSGATETLLTCTSGGRMIVSEFAPNAATPVDCECVPDVPGQDNRAGDELGYAVAAGDFDCDGDADLAIGAPGESISGESDAGAVYLYRGSSQGLRPWRRLTPTTVGIAAEAGARFGHALAAGRFNGDCQSDLAIGAPGAEGGRGAAVLVPGIFRDGLRFEQAQSFGVPTSLARYGEAFAVGDFDADGVSDLAIGAPERVRNDLSTGRVYVFRGTNAADPSQDLVASLTSFDPTGPASGLRFGAALAFGNVKGGAGAELVVGAPGRRRIDPIGSVTRNYGAIYVIESGGTMAEISAPLPGDFGAQVAVGDIRGNTFEDIAASSPSAGLVYTLTGATSGPGSPSQVVSCGGACAAGRSLAIFPRPGRDDLLIGFAGSDRVDQFRTYPNGLFLVTQSFDEALWSAPHDPGDGRAGNCPKLDDIDSHQRCPIDQLDFASDFAAFGSAVTAADFGQGTQLAIGAPQDSVGFGTSIRSGSLYVRGGSPTIAQEYRVDQVAMTYGGSPVDTTFRSQVKAHEFFCVFGQTCDLADVNGDGRADLVAFVKATVADQVGDVYVALAEGVAGFGPAQRWHDDFCTHNDQECTLADVDGDGRADLVAFLKDTVPGEQGYVRAALANTTGGFGASSVWLARDACRGSELCRLGHLNNDSAADLVVFSRGTSAGVAGFGDVRVAFANPITRTFAPGWTQVHDLFCVRNERCLLGDVDADGDDDLLALVTSADFGNQGFVWVAETSPSPVPFGTAIWHRSFCTDSRQCDVGDVDGDGRVDLVRFTQSHDFRAEFALSNGNDFGPLSTAGLSFCSPGQVCRVADVNDDSRADLVRFSKNAVAGSEGDVWVALSGRAP